MGKLLDEYQNKVETMEALFVKDSKGEASENALRFARMLMVARKGQIRLHFAREMGPILINKALERCDPDFTFEDVLAEVDRMLEGD